ncbi:MAG TPA: YetF domain-containing protein [Burkholderiales bacterium]
MTLDWHALFVPEMPLEMVVRGTVSYWFLFALFRFGVRRRIGAVGMADILILVIVSDAIQQSMAGEYVSITDGFILVGVLVGWTVFTDWLAFRFRAIERVLEPPPLQLIHKGAVLHRNLRAEFISESELKAKLREAGAEDYAEVERAFMESDGKITVILRRGASSR